MELSEVNLKQFKDATQALVVSDQGQLAMDEIKGPFDAQSSTTAKRPVSKRKLALSLSDFLKKQRSLLALRRQGDGKQTQP